MVELLGAFAGSVIGVFLITALVEGVRRAAREYDRRIVAQAHAAAGLTERAGLTGGSVMKGGSATDIAGYVWNNLVHFVLS